jgi:hypothetical protein
VSIIGGRFGSKSNDSSYSISQTELRVALELSKQVYIFVEREVYHEYRTFERNRDAKIKWASVDNPRIYEFLSEVYSLKNNNPIQPFETSYDITEKMREQWAGLFQRLLAQQSLSIQASMFHDLKQSLETVRSLVDVVASQADRRDEVVANIILVNHPLFAALRKQMGVPYRFVIENRKELEEWLGARGFTEDAFASDEGTIEWFRANKAAGSTEVVRVSSAVFDDQGKLRPFTAAEWLEEFVTYQVRKTQKSPAFDSDLDDDVPF